MEKIKMKKWTARMLILSCVVLCTHLAGAETSQQEIGALAKVISLSKDVPAGDVAIAVVYDPANAVSQKDLESVKSFMEGGFKGPKHTFTAKAVAVSDVNSIAGDKLVFVTEGLDASTQVKVKDLAMNHKILTATTDMSCVENGNCLIGVDVSSGVSILMNAATYAASGLTFDAAFKFMVKQI